MTADDDAFTVSLTYDADKRRLSSSEDCPIIGTYGDTNATSVRVQGLYPLTGKNVYLAFDVRELDAHKVRTDRVQLEIEGDVGTGEIPPKVFNSVLHGRLPVQLMVQWDDGSNHRYFSFNQITFKVAPAICTEDYE